MRIIGTIVAVGLFGLSLPSVGVWAHPRATVVLQSSTVLAQRQEQVVLTVHTKAISGPIKYAFRVKAATGGWMTIKRLGPGDEAVFRPARDGTYWLQGVVRYGAGRHMQTLISSPSALYVGPRPALSASTQSLPAGHTVVLTAQAGAVAHAQYQFWYRPQAGHWAALDSFSAKDRLGLRLSGPGPYEVKVEVRSPQGVPVASAPVAITAYGAPAAIDLIPGRSVWVADGTESETLTAKVVDSQGDVVSDFDGSGSLIATSANGAVSQWGQSLASLTPLAGGDHLALTFVHGVALAWIQAGSDAATDDFSASAALAGGKVLSGSTSITAVPQVASAISLTATSTYLIANESGNPANYVANVVDQVGEPMLTGTYTLAASIQGPGQFQDLTQGPDTVTINAGIGPAAVTVYSIAGELGPVTLTLSAPNLKSAAVTVPAILGGQPYQFGVSAAQTTLAPGQSTTLTLTQLTKTGGVSDPASLDNSGYVVSITAANGSAATGFSLDGVAYTGTPVEFAVAGGPNFFYAVSQPVTLTVTDAAPGSYDIVVADADGLWKPSPPLTMTVLS